MGQFLIGLGFAIKVIGGLLFIVGLGMTFGFGFALAWSKLHPKPTKTTRLIINDKNEIVAYVTCDKMPGFIHVYSGLNERWFRPE